MFLFFQAEDGIRGVCLSRGLGDVYNGQFLVLAVFALAMGGCSDETGLKIKSISPDSGPAGGGGSVTIHGNGFQAGGAMSVEVYSGYNKARFLRFLDDN